MKDHTLIGKDILEDVAVYCIHVFLAWHLIVFFFPWPAVKIYSDNIMDDKGE